MAGGRSLREAVESLAAERTLPEAEPTPADPRELIAAVGGPEEARRILREAAYAAEPEAGPRRRRTLADTVWRRVDRWQSGEVVHATERSAGPLLAEWRRRARRPLAEAFRENLADTLAGLARRGCRWAVESELRVSQDVRFRRRPAVGLWPMYAAATRSWVAAARARDWPEAEERFLELGLRSYLAPELAGEQLWGGDFVDAEDEEGEITWIELAYGRGGR